MKILEVCVGLPRALEYRDKKISSGIFKVPTNDAVEVSYSNLDGDRQADLNVHGGRDKAIYVYPREHYDYWAQALNADALQSSQFGENLTVSGAIDNDVVIGDRYRLGTAEVVVTQPRLPCYKLGIRLNDSKFPARFLASGRLGYYLRVAVQGVLQKGDIGELLERPSHGITVHALWASVIRDSANDLTASKATAELQHLDDGWLRRLRRLQRQPAVNCSG
jgi:MOSC domain-containing protein YiiM